MSEPEPPLGPRPTHDASPPAVDEEWFPEPEATAAPSVEPPPAFPADPPIAGVTADAAEVARLRRILRWERAAFAVILVAFGWLHFAPQWSAGRWVVFVNDRPVFAMPDRDTAQSVIDRVKQTESEGSARADFREKVRLDFVRGRTGETVTADVAARRLAAAVSVRAERAVIYIDGISAVALPDAETANSVLEEFKAQYASRPPNLDSPPRFKEQVEVRTEQAEADIWADATTAQGLLRGEGSDAEHTVRRGDNAWTIGRKYDLTYAKLKQMNPGVNLLRLRIGQVLNVGEQPEPVLTVITEGRETVELKTPPPTQFRPSLTMFVGKQLLLSPGKPGRVQVIQRVTCENGVVTSRSELEKRVLQAPHPRTVAIGTRPRYDLRGRGRRRR